MKFLVKNSRGKPSWPLTIVIFAGVLVTGAFIRSMFLDSMIPVGEYAEALLLLLGPLVVNEIGDKIAANVFKP